MVGVAVNKRVNKRQIFPRVTVLLCVHINSARSLVYRASAHSCSGRTILARFSGSQPLFFADKSRPFSMPFRPSAVVCAKKSSSKVWLARQARDPYVKLRASDGSAAAASTSYRSRSAFKLLEMDDKWRFLTPRDVRVVLDLGSAPGGWSQVVAQKLGWDETPAPHVNAVLRDSWSATNPLDISDSDLNGESLGRGRGTIVAVDLLRMSPIPGVQFVQADFLVPETESLIRGLIARQAGNEGKADIILCDMAGNSTGNAFHDIESSLAICTSVFEFTKRHIRSAQSIGREMGGVLLIKHFAHPLLHHFRTQHLVPNFNDVKYLKPNASRTESKEGYFLCRGWKG
ncbi:Ribosomal RNA large subunit methyltransferase E [Mycena venus]|uniref:rRNA methyltransferase 2, mitochondrial n=1 Tax=Mycena venus TaxID=2733690 RepID=A0A8H6WUS7_9AGAR|nr:Ribosomal RNA large subunit methyltransferase E [Mycena venus]